MTMDEALDYIRRVGPGHVGPISITEPTEGGYQVFVFVKSKHTSDYYGDVTECKTLADTIELLNNLQVPHTNRM